MATAAPCSSAANQPLDPIRHPRGPIGTRAPRFVAIAISASRVNPQQSASPTPATARLRQMVPAPCPASHCALSLCGRSCSDQRHQQALAATPSAHSSLTVTAPARQTITSARQASCFAMSSTTAAPRLHLAPCYTRLATTVWFAPTGLVRDPAGASPHRSAPAPAARFVQHGAHPGCRRDEQAAARRRGLPKRNAGAAAPRSRAAPGAGDDRMARLRAARPPPPVETERDHIGTVSSARLLSSSEHRVHEHHGLRNSAAIHRRPGSRLSRPSRARGRAAPRRIRSPARTHRLVAARPQARHHSPCRACRRSRSCRSLFRSAALACSPSPCASRASSRLHPRACSRARPASPGITDPRFLPPSTRDSDCFISAAHPHECLFLAAARALRALHIACAMGACAGIAHRRSRRRRDRAGARSRAHSRPPRMIWRFSISNPQHDRPAPRCSIHDRRPHSSSAAGPPLVCSTPRFTALLMKAWPPIQMPMPLRVQAGPDAVESAIACGPMWKTGRASQTNAGSRRPRRTSRAPLPIPRAGVGVRLGQVVQLLDLPAQALAERPRPGGRSRSASA